MRHRRQTGAARPRHWLPSWIVRFLPAATDAALSLVDLGVVVGAFLLAYWLRFIVPDDLALALGLEHYIRMAVAVGIALCMPNLRTT